MATFNVDIIARLVPAEPPGKTASALREAAAEQHPAISLATVQAVLSFLARAEQVTRIDDPSGDHRYHLATEEP